MGLLEFGPFDTVESQEFLNKKGESLRHLQKKIEFQYFRWLKTNHLNPNFTF